MKNKNISNKGLIWDLLRNFEANPENPHSYKRKKSVLWYWIFSQSLDLSDKEEGKSDTADDVIVDVGSDFDGFSNEYKVSRSFENLILCVDSMYYFLRLV